MPVRPEDYDKNDQGRVGPSMSPAVDFSLAVPPLAPQDSDLLRNHDALFAPRSFYLGWAVSRGLLVQWCAFQVAVSFLPVGLGLNILGFLIAVTALWFYLVPQMIGKEAGPSVDVVSLTQRAFIRQFLPTIWCALASVPAAAAGVFVAFSVLQDDAVPVAPLVFAATWLAGGAILNMLVFGLHGGWRVSLINVGGAVAGILLALLSLAASASVDFPPVERLKLATFICMQIAMMPIGVIILGWAINKTLHEHRATLQCPGPLLERPQDTYHIRINGQLIGPLERADIERRSARWRRLGIQVEVGQVGGQSFVSLSKFLSLP
jgi:hypothetical protein